MLFSIVVNKRIQSLRLLCLSPIVRSLQIYTLYVTAEKYVRIRDREREHREDREEEIHREREKRFKENCYNNTIEETVNTCIYKTYETKSKYCIKNFFSRNVLKIALKTKPTGGLRHVMPVRAQVE